MVDTTLSATVPHVAKKIVDNNTDVVAVAIDQKINDNHDVVVKDFVSQKIKDNDPKMRNWVAKKIEEEMKKFGSFSTASIRRL